VFVLTKVKVRWHSCGDCVGSVVKVIAVNTWQQ
jgi:hypothetical protein